MRSMIDFEGKPKSTFSFPPIHDSCLENFSRSTEAASSIFTLPYCRHAQAWMALGIACGQELGSLELQFISLTRGWIPVSLYCRLRDPTIRL